MITVNKKIDDEIVLLSMKNDDFEVIVSNFGCTIVSIFTRDKDGKMGDVVLGYDNFSDYKTKDAYLGALVGRVANRIGKGEFSLNGETYHVAINNGPNHLHGGIKGFSYRVFDYEIKDENTIEFTYFSKDGEENYPGNMAFKAIYSIVGTTLNIRYQATTDKDTLINITNHSYFNLSCKEENIYNHALEIAADRFACIDGDGLPTGQFRETKCSAFDFTTPTLIGKKVVLDDEQLKLGLGFDHPFIFTKDHDQVVLIHEKSGRKLTVSTTLPGAQIYTANYLDGRTGKYGQQYFMRDAICIETQNLPDAIHLEENPSTILRKGQVYDESTSYCFEVIK